MACHTWANQKGTSLQIRTSWDRIIQHTFHVTRQHVYLFYLTHCIWMLHINMAMISCVKLRQLDSRNNVLMTLKLFDTLVTPILTYGSPVWGPTLVKESSKDFKKICDSAIPEKLNVKLCKYLLGTGKYSVNDAVRGELGRYPILIKILSHSVKFSQRVEKLPDSSVVKLSHQDAVQWSETYKCTSWLHKLDHCIKRFNCTLNDSATKLQHAMEHD